MPNQRMLSTKNKKAVGAPSAAVFFVDRAFLVWQSAWTREAVEANVDVSHVVSYR